jgi:hypothetical protein
MSASTPDSTPADQPVAGASVNEAPARDRFIDAVRAGALMVVVLGHWLATLPRVDQATTVGNDHLLHVWPAAGYMTWVLQVVPLFVLVSAAATTSPQPGATLSWWAGRAQRLARPTATYLAVLAGLHFYASSDVEVSFFTGLFSDSLTVHLWFIVMLLLVQAALPLAHRLDARWGLVAVGSMITVAVLADTSRFLLAGGGSFGDLGLTVSTAPAGFGWINVVAIWLVPQQLGIAWKAGRLHGRRAGAALVAGGVGFALACVQLGYPISMVGSDLETGASNVLPPTVALLGIMAIQTGLVLLLEDPIRRWLQNRTRWKVVQIVGALGMPLYLWHKLAELPALWAANRLGIVVDRALPGDPGFWAGRGVWIGLCAVASVPVIVAVVAFEKNRRSSVPQTAVAWRLFVGGAAVVGATAYALSEGLSVTPAAAVITISASLLLRSERFDHALTRRNG